MNMPCNPHQDDVPPNNKARLDDRRALSPLLWFRVAFCGAAAVVLAWLLLRPSPSVQDGYMRLWPQSVPIIAETAGVWIPSGLLDGAMVSAGQIVGRIQLPMVAESLHETDCRVAQAARLAIGFHVDVDRMPTEELRADKYQQFVLACDRFCEAMADRRRLLQSVAHSAVRAPAVGRVVGLPLSATSVTVNVVLGSIAPTNGSLTAEVCAPVGPASKLYRQAFLNVGMASGGRRGTLVAVSGSLTTEIRSDMRGTPELWGRFIATQQDHVELGVLRECVVPLGRDVLGSSLRQAHPREPGGGTESAADLFRRAAAVCGGTLRLPAVLTPTRVRRLSFEVPGILSAVAVQPGQVVTQGQVLAFLDATSASHLINVQEARVALARTRVASAETGARVLDDKAAAMQALGEEGVVPVLESIEFGRNRELAVHGIASATEALRVEEAEREKLDWLAGRCSLSSPMDGVVGQVHLAAGEAVGAYEPVVRLESAERDVVMLLPYVPEACREHLVFRMVGRAETTLKACWRESASVGVGTWVVRLSVTDDFVADSTGEISVDVSLDEGGAHGEGLGCGHGVDWLLGGP